MEGRIAGPSCEDSSRRPSCEDSSRRRFEQQVVETTTANGGAGPKNVDSTSGRAVAGPSCEDSSRRRVKQPPGQQRADVRGAGPKYEDSSHRRVQFHQGRQKVEVREYTIESPLPFGGWPSRDTAPAAAHVICEN